MDLARALDRLACVFFSLNPCRVDPGQHRSGETAQRVGLHQRWECGVFMEMCSRSVVETAWSFVCSCSSKV